MQPGMCLFYILVNLYIQAAETMSKATPVKCHECGQYHAWDAIEVIFEFPDAYFKIHEEERADRVQMNKEICIVDGVHHIRGVVPVKTTLADKPVYHWGVWVKVEPEAFAVIYDNWDVEDQSHLTLKGKLANEIRYYGNTRNKAIRIQPISNKTRPHFYFTRDQRLMEIQNKKVTARTLMSIFHYHFD